MQQVFSLFGTIDVDLSDFNNALDEVNQGAQNIQQNMQQVGENMTNMGASMTAGISTPLIGFGAAAAQAAISADNAMAQIANATATTTEEAEKLTEAARNVYKEGYGESLEEVSAALTQVKNNMKLIDDSEIEQATESAMILAKTLEVEVSEVTRGAHGLMTGFGIEAATAFDKIAGATDLNFSGDLMDQMAEFSHIAASAGYTLDSYFEMLRRGSEAGVYNMDRINNAILEFDLRAKDVGASEEAFSQLSEATNELWQAMLNGKGSSDAVAESVIRDLRAMDDQTAANAIGISLWGSTWEDNSRMTMYQLYDTTTALESTTKSMEDLAAASEETFSQKWASFLRVAQDSLIPIGTILLDLGTKYLPIVAGWIEKVANAFAALPDGAQTTIVVLGILVALLGPLIMMFGMFVSSVGSIIGMFGSLAGGMRTATAAASGIIGALGNIGNSTGGAASGLARLLPIIGRVGGVLLRFVPMIGTALTAFTILKGLFSTFGGDTVDGFIAGVTAKIEEAKTAIKNIAIKISTTFKEFFGIASPSKLFTMYGAWLIQGLINGVKSLVGAVLGVFSSLFMSIQKVIKNGLSIAASFAKNGFNAIATGAQQAGSRIKSAISGAITSALNTAKTAASKAYSLGADIVNGIAKGVRSGVKKATDAIDWVSSKILGGFKKSNGINSPAKLYIQEAAHLPGGIAEGIRSGVDVTANAIKNVVKKTGDAFIQARDGLPLDMPLDTLGMTPNFDAATARLSGLQDVPQSIRGFNAGGKGQQKGGKMFDVYGGINIQVNEVSDLTPQEIENDVSNRFFPNARERE